MAGPQSNAPTDREVQEYDAAARRRRPQPSPWLDGASRAAGGTGAQPLAPLFQSVDVEAQRRQRQAHDQAVSEAGYNHDYSGGDFRGGDPYSQWSRHIDPEGTDTRQVYNWLTPTGMAMFLLGQARNKYDSVMLPGRVVRGEVDPFVASQQFSPGVSPLPYPVPGPALLRGGSLAGPKDMPFRSYRKRPEAPDDFI
jgi:hypothetical protein